jgi:hypothetical protein
MADFVLLEKICKEIQWAQIQAESEYKRERFGDQFVPEFLIMREDKIKVEIRKENTSHQEPHIHITHSDKIDASVSLLDFRVLAGKIDRKTLKYLLTRLQPKKAQLQSIWDELNEKDNSISVEKMINNLGL